MLRRSLVQEAHDALPHLLRARVERQSCRRAAEQHDELAPFQLIELHPTPKEPGLPQDIQFTTISQEIREKIYNSVYEICRTSIPTENVHPRRVDTDTATRPDGRRLEGAGARAKLFNVVHSDRSATNAR